MERPTAFFTEPESGWFVAQDPARGPWHPEHCHAGPVTGLIARAAETALPDHRLTRLLVDLGRPVPTAGFRIEATTGHVGRSVARVSLAVLDADDREVTHAEAMAIGVEDVGPLPSPPAEPLDPDRAEPGPFPFTRRLHDLGAFNGPGVEVRYPDGEDREPGPTTLWMRTVPLLADEVPSPFQRICPLADCGNAISRNAEPWEVGFVNADLTVVLHRDPVGEWLGATARSDWHPSGIGMADALLFDRQGPVGRAVQSLVLRPSG